MEETQRLELEERIREVREKRSELVRKRQLDTFGYDEHLGRLRRFLAGLFHGIDDRAYFSYTGPLMNTYFEEGNLQQEYKRLTGDVFRAST